ncbi:lysophospholipid acyltransferase family protein [Sporosarcina sp. CAU 1771]
MDPSIRDLYIDEIPKKWALGILNQTGSTFSVSGIENLPEGPVLFISNHEGNFDIPVLIAHIPKPFGFISKVEVKKLPIIREWMIEMNCVFLDRSNRRSAMNVLDDAAVKLKEGHSMLIFPEGTRSKSEGVQTFKSGFAKIAQLANVPIVPIALSGTSIIMEKNNNIIKPAHVKIAILPLISAEQCKNLSRAELLSHANEMIKLAVEKQGR